MDATVQQSAERAPNEYTKKPAQPGALVWFFRKSRDGWKKKAPRSQGQSQGV